MIDLDDRLVVGGIDISSLIEPEQKGHESQSAISDLWMTLPDLIINDPSEQRIDIAKLWPREYINNKTKLPYSPHKEAERVAVYTDSTRYTLFKGGEGCIAPETKVGGVPIAERTTGFSVRTLYGQSMATQGYLKGKDDLYLVELENGKSVSVTRSHRFLTPTGYKRLKVLSVGDLIAVSSTSAIPKNRVMYGLPGLDYCGVDTWVAIKSIKFDRYGDYYDLQVPIFEHYICDNGIVHHNSGKSVAGIVKGLDRAKRGLDGICVSPDFPHFRRSLWAEWQRWCPWDCVIEPHRYMGNIGWGPYKPFSITFLNGATIYFGGIENPISWEGPNVNWAHFDEARRKENADALKVLDGRVRVWGEANVSPQLWITTTPAKHWLFDYFGPVKRICNKCQEEFQPDVDEETECPACGSEDTKEDDTDTFIAFKRDSRVVTLVTQENEVNLGGSDEDGHGGYAEKRGQSLTEAEKRVYLLGLWEDAEDTQRFLPSMSLWDNCRIDDLQPLTSRVPIVIAIDAGVSNDYFAMVAVSAHPELEEGATVRISMLWIPPKDGKIDFQGDDLNPGPEMMIEKLCQKYNVLSLAYDPYQLHDMGTRLEKRRLARDSTKLKIGEIKEFQQGVMRIKADTQLLNSISQGIIAHDGTHVDLTAHLNNADRKTDKDGRNLRIIKRSPAKKIDLAVCLSMAVERFSSMPLRVRMPKKMKFIAV